MKDDIYIFDFDGTIIDSSHRGITNRDGSINLEYWKQHNTKDHIFQDTLLPLYSYAKWLSDIGAYCVGCTARELTKYDEEFFLLCGFDKIFKRIISRPIGNTTKDCDLKSMQLQYLFNLKAFKKKNKYFFDDNAQNRYALMKMGAFTFDPIEYMHNDYGLIPDKL